MASLIFLIVVLIIIIISSYIFGVDGIGTESSVLHNENLVVYNKVEELWT